jgi:hypothetical protein
MRRKRAQSSEGKMGASQRFPKVCLHEVQPSFFGDRIGLREGYHACRDLEQVQNGKMFSRLRHDSFVGRYDQERNIDASDTRQHVLDEINVSRYVDDPHHRSCGRERSRIICGIGVRWRRQSQPGKTQVDRHLALFFLAQAIWVNPGQGVHQGGLAVVDVSGGADHIHEPLPCLGAALQRSAHGVEQFLGVAQASSDKRLVQSPQRFDFSLQRSSVLLLGTKRLRTSG